MSRVAFSFSKGTEFKILNSRMKTNSLRIKGSVIHLTILFKRKEHIAGR